MLRSTTYEAPLGLGDFVREKLTGIEGRCIGVCFYETGCTQIGVKRIGVDKDGKPFDLLWFEEPNVDLIAEAGDDDEALAPNSGSKPGGPMTAGMSPPSGQVG